MRSQLKPSTSLSTSLSSVSVLPAALIGLVYLSSICIGFTHHEYILKGCSLVCRAGLGSLELYAMGLKATGSYLARTLSYAGAEFNIAKEHIDPVFA